MKKFSCCLLPALFFALFLHAQERSYLPKPRLSAGPEIAFPAGSFGDLFSIGFGGSLKVEVPVTREFYLTATAGYKTFYLKEGSKDLKINKGYVPLKAGGKYYLSPLLYAEGEVGVSIGTNKNAGSALAWAPGVGVSLPFTKDGYIDAGLRYERWARDGGNIEQVGVRIAYKF